MDLDRFFHRRYSQDLYNCAHFTAEVWEALTGDNIEAKLGPFLHAPSERSAPLALRASFRRLEKPENPCIVLMQRRGLLPHVGVYLNRRIFHIQAAVGVQFLPPEVVTFGFHKIGYYKC